VTQSVGLNLSPSIAEKEKGKKAMEDRGVVSGRARVSHVSSPGFNLQHRKKKSLKK
jgi:hypothetical protein